MNKKKKILIHTIAFSPDAVSTAYLYADIAIGLRNNNYDVIVLTTTPHYNLVDEELLKQPLKKHWGGLFYKSFYEGIPIYHVPQKKFKSFVARIIGFIYWHFLSLFLGLFQKDISLILSPSPPLTIGLVSLILAKLKGAKVIYNVQEIYPDFLINQRNLKSGVVVKLLKRLERLIYKYLDATTTIDEVFYKTIVCRFNNPAKLSIIPNFVDTEIYRTIENPENFLDGRIFPHKPVLKLMYAGNIGHAQDWEPLLTVAKNLSESPVEFWIIGEGVAKKALQKDIQDNNLKNIHLLPYQSRQQMPYLIAYADIHFIFMNPKMDSQGFPSKVYTIMACKKPLVVMSGIDTPLYNFLKSKNCAYLISRSDLDERCMELEHILKEAMDNKSTLKNMGINGYNVIENKYSKNQVVKQYIQLIENLS